MSGAGTVALLVRHEARLAWRDWLAMMTAGRRRRMRSVLLGIAVFVALMHGFAYFLLRTYDLPADAADQRLLTVLTGVLALAWSLMLSQAMEAVTRALYSRGDLDLVLTAPIAPWRLFAIRIAAMTLTIMLTATAIAAPFIDVMIWRAGPQWLGAYGVAVALGMLAMSAAVLLCIALFRSIGPRRTRLVAQIVAAVIGAAFVIGMQLAAILSYGTVSRIAFPQANWLAEFVADRDSILAWPARAVLGDVAALLAMLGLGAAALGVVIYFVAPRFQRYVLAAAGLSFGARRQGRDASIFRAATPAQVLRRKEWVLLRRDPWLVSQTLMQLLYLLPPAFLLWRNFGAGAGVSILLVPVLIMAAGQLSGALAWLAISGEDAPDLIGSAPLPPASATRAKTGAVLTAITLVFAPFVLALAFASPYAALVAICGIAIAAVSAATIQIWFRSQAKRSHFRRRQNSSRVATFAEALSSSSWAATGALAAAGTWVAIAPFVLALAIIGGTRLISPAAADRGTL